MKYAFFLIVFCTLVMCSMSKLQGFLGLTNPHPADCLDDALAKTLCSPNKWMYRVSWIENASAKGLSHSFWAAYEFCDRKFTEPEKAVRLFVDIYKEHLRRINSIRILRPFLYEFPITPTTCSLGVNFFNERRDFFNPPILSRVHAGQGYLTCSQFEKDRPAGEWHVHVYKKNLFDVDEFKVLYQQGVKRSKCEIAPNVPIFKKYHWRYKDAATLHLLDWIDSFCAKNSLSNLAIGTVGNLYNDYRPFGFLLMGHQQLMLDKARMLAISCFNDCFSFLKGDTDCCAALKKRSTWEHKIFPSPEPVAEHVAFRISFWDENIDRQIQPFVADIRYFDGVFRYYTADDVQRLLLVHQETYEEAMKFWEQHQQSQNLE